MRLASEDGGCVLAVLGLNRREGLRPEAGRGRTSGRSLVCLAKGPFSPSRRLYLLTQPRDNHGDLARASAARRAPSPRAGEPARPSPPAPFPPRRATAGPALRDRTSVRAQGGGDRRVS